MKLHGLGIWESGFRDLTNSKRPVVNVEDVYGLRVRVMENKIHQELWKALGADPVPCLGEMPIPAYSKGL